MDQERHWNSIGQQYADEIFDVFANDKNGILNYYFDQFANSTHVALDVGCGIGKAFHQLAPRFKKVIGSDISSRLLAQAKLLPYKNIELVKADLTKPNIKFELADFAFCCNVIMFSQEEKNKALFSTIHRSLKEHGNAMIVLPSIESMMYSTWRLIDWYRKEGVELEEIPRNELNYYPSKKFEILRGNVQINGVPTKHYSAPELEVILDEIGFRIHTFEKVDYEWTTEFESPPIWMKAPYPWDWLVVCTKK